MIASLAVWPSTILINSSVEPCFCCVKVFWIYVIYYNQLFLATATFGVKRLLLAVVRCICCAVTMKHYVEPNMSLKSRTTVHCVLNMLSSICEGILFMYLGLAAVVSAHQFDLAFIVVVLAACLISRVIGM